MVLLISFLLLVALSALIMEASMNTANVTDATAEEQAYYAAESGIQSVIHTLRHNTAPNPLIDPSKTPIPPDPDADPANKLDYFKAVRIATSNKTTPTAADCAGATPPLDCVARLSRWLNYGNNAAFPDRVVLGDPAAYTERNGFAFRVTVSDPDNVGGTVSYLTSSVWNPPVPSTNPIVVAGNRITIHAAPANAAEAGNSLEVEYVSSSPYTKDVSSGIANTDFGKFVVTGRGPTFAANGVTIVSSLRFGVRVQVTQPYDGIRILRGYLEKGNIKAGNVGTTEFFFDSRDFVIFGSVITLTGGSLFEQGPPSVPTGPGGTYRNGYGIPMPVPAAADVPVERVINGTVTSPEPLRILVRATGFGPHGARKELESIVQKNYFSGLGAPSPLTLIGPPCTPVGTCSPPPLASAWAAPNFVFDPGSSNGTIYSGKDKKLKAFLPPVGLTHDPNMAYVGQAIQGAYGPFNGNVFGNVSNVSEELPSWLTSPRNLDKTLDQLKATAIANGKYYGPLAPRPAYGGGRYGDFATATGITYIDGDLEFAQDGGGILVVTGALTFKGGFEWNGLVIVTGAGGILRTGGGSGSLQGNMIVAPYTRTGAGNGLTCSDNVLVTNKLNCFLAPRYNISGGGSSEIVYNSNNVTNGLGALTNFVKGVAEK